MFTYQLSEPRRPIASALQSTLIHASLIAGAVVATKAAPAIVHPPHDPISLTWPGSPTTRAPVSCGCGVSLPHGLSTVPEIPDIPRVPIPGGSPRVDPTTLVDDTGLPPTSGNVIDSTSAATIFDEMVVDDPPTLLAAGLLRYPAILDAARVEGSVTLSFVIDTEGRVEQDGIQVISATDAGFIPAAKEAVLTSRFHPAMKSHHPVRVRVQQVITFKR